MGVSDENLERAKVLAEHRYRAVLEVRAGQPVSEVAARYGVSRQSVSTWCKRYADEGLDGLQERSRRPHSSPARVSAVVEAQICEMRREHRRWGARRIVFELSRAGLPVAPGRATVHRILVRNGLVRPQEQRHPRKYKRWQRETPMQLWQLDLVGGIHLADGRECKLLSGIDDHSRFVVVAAVLERPSGNAVVEAFIEATNTFGVPFEVLTDNGKQFTGRFTRPLPVEVLFERTCREMGVTQRLTKRRSPTTTGKVERWHQTLRRELLDEAGAFADLATAQRAIDSWVDSYNEQRPHQSLDMVTPASLFRARPTVAPAITVPGDDGGQGPAAPPMPAALGEGVAVEFEVIVPRSGSFPVAGQQVWMGRQFAGRSVTIWAGLVSIHIVLDGMIFKTVPSRLTDSHLSQLLGRGGRPAGPEPSAAALPIGRPLPPAVAIELDRTATRDGVVQVGGHNISLGPELAGARVTLRLVHNLIHAVSDGHLVKTVPSPIDAAGRSSLRGSRRVEEPLPPRPISGPITVHRKVPRDGVTMVANQRLRVGRTYAGKTVTVVVEDTHFRIYDGGTELAVHPRTTKKWVRIYKAGIRK